MRWLFLPGLHCLPTIWDPARVHLDADDTLVMLDWPTDGLSSMDDAAHWLGEAIDTHEPDVVVGHSLGGTTLLHLFGHLGRRPMPALVVVDSFMTLPHPMFRNHVWDDDTLRLWVERMLAEVRPRQASLREMAMAFEEDDAWIAAAMQTSARFVYGGRAGEVDDATLYRRAGLPAGEDHRATVIPGTSHFLMIEAPARFYPALREAVAAQAR